MDRINIHKGGMPSQFTKTNKGAPVKNAGMPCDGFLPGAKQKFKNITAADIAGVVLNKPKEGHEVLWESSSGIVKSFNKHPVEINDKVIFKSTSHFHCFDAKTGFQKWKYETNYWDSFPPIDGKNGMIYIGDDNKLTVAALDEQTGERQWKRELGFLTSPPAPGADDTLFVGTAGRDEPLKGDNRADVTRNYVFALDASTGETKWSKTLENPVTALGANSAGDPVFAGKKGDVMCLDNKDGSVKWQKKLDCSHDLYHRADPYGNIVSGNHEELFFVDSDTGAVKWKKTGTGLLNIPPSKTKSGNVVWGYENNKIKALDAKNGDEIWEYDVPMESGWNPRTTHLNDGNLYICDTKKVLHSVNAETGEKNWDFQMNSRIDGSPAVTKEGVLYVGQNSFETTNHRDLLVINTDNGEPLKDFRSIRRPTFTASKTNPEVLYLGDVKGNVRAVKSARVSLKTEDVKEALKARSRKKAGLKVVQEEKSVLIDGVELPIRQD